jgi:hypothetical protein
MSAAALKGLVINTAHEAGPNPGPDYMHGWGLLNSLGAAALIQKDNEQGGLIVEGILNSGQTIDYTYYSDGSDINVTLIWPDLPGTPPAASLNPSTLMLVNDLNLRVIRQDPATTYFPWRLNPSNPSAAATKGNNFRDNVETVNVTNPSSGYYTIRVNHSGTLSGGQQAYALIITGLETPPAETYCTARATSQNFEYIQRVQMGSIDNRSGRSAGGYHDYRGLVHNVNKGGSQSITVTLNGYSNSTGRVWVDWNQNGTFQLSESIDLGTGPGPYTTTINVPPDALGGYTTMRVRVGFSSSPPACGTVTYGETEDYTIRVLGTPGLWTGTVSSDWFDPKNWSDGFVPTQTTNVTIPAGTPFSPVIGGGGTAYCNNLYVQSGATLTQNSTSFFRVHGIFDPAFGQFIMNGTNSFLYFEGTTSNSWWNDGVPDVYTNVRINKSDPAAIVTMRNNTTCSGTFQVWNGTFALSPNRTLTVTSAAIGSFRVENNGTLNLVAGQTIETSGGVHFLNGSNTNVTGGNIKCGGRFRIDNNTSNNIHFSGATVELNGSGSQLLQDFDGSSIHHLVIDKPSGTATIDQADLIITGNLTIDGGAFSLGSRTCNVAGITDVNAGGTLTMTNGGNNLTSATLNWNSGSVANVTAGTFNVSNWRFNPGTTAMITTGNTAYIKNMFIPIEPTSHFGHLVIQPFAAILGEPEGRAANPVNVAGNLTVQTGASWFFPSSTGLFVSGNSTIQDGASLTFNDGAVFNTTGSLNLSGALNVNSTSEVLVNGGASFPSSCVLSINNGSFISDNPHTGNWSDFSGSFTLSSGLFELSENNPRFTASASTNVSGGIIRTGGAFSASGSTFQPSGGIVELAGTNPATGAIFCYADSYFHDLLINRPTFSFGQFSLDMTIKNDLTIQNGTFQLHPTAGDLYIGGDFINMVGSSAFQPYSNKVIFDGTGVGNHQHLTGSTNFYDIENAKTGGGELRFQGTANISNDFLANGVNVVSGPSMTVGGLLNLSTGSLGLTSAGPDVNVNNFTTGGTLTVNGGSFTCTDLTNAGVFGTVNLSNGSITLNQDPGQFPDIRGTINISAGTMTINGGNGTSWWGWGGTPTHVQMTGGVLDFNTMGVTVHTGYTITTAISGGTIKTSGIFSVTHPNFTPIGGRAELYGSAPATVRTENGSNFYNLRIDKSGGTLLGFEPEDDLFSLGKIDERLAGIDAGEDREPGKYLPDGGRSGGVASTSGILNVTNNTVVNAGTLEILHDATMHGNITVNSGGTLQVNELGSVALGASRSLTVNNGGALDLNGDIMNQPRITRISSGNYALNVESGGTIGAVYAIFEHMNTNGVNLKPGAMVDPAKAFHHSTFRNGQSGGRLLTLNNSQAFAVNYANFPNNTWGGTYNVFKTENAGVVTFMGFTGLFSGEANEWDPFSRVHWGGETAANVSLQGVDIAPGQEICFEATNTLTLGGSGSSFAVQNGGYVELVAGQRIRLLEGVHFHNGSYGLMRITTSGDYCSLPAPLMAVAEEKFAGVEEVIETNLQDKFFKVYPNPTTGMFNLELSEITSTITVEIYGLMGEQVLRQEVSGYQLYEFDLSRQPRGIYIIRVLNGDEIGVERVIRQ